MPFRFKRKEDVGEALKRMVGEQVDRAIAEIRDPELDRHTAVHQVRKRCKKIRAALRLVRMENGKLHDRENARFRDLSKRLSGMRDAQTAINTYDALMARFQDRIDRKAFGSIRAALTRRRKRLAIDEGALEALLAETLKDLEQARADIDKWKIKSSGFSTIRAGLQRTYERGRAGLKRSYKTGRLEDFHDWRKRAKYHRYQVSTLRGLWPDMVDRRRHGAMVLGELIGDDHDLALLAQLLKDERESFGNEDVLAMFEALIAERRKELQDKARPLAKRLYAESPKAIGNRFRKLWKVWR
ncbi:CHAD domain-containing protein [bacterium]|nr:CHAD domain-containing protein [bacterium]